MATGTTLPVVVRLALRRESVRGWASVGALSLAVTACHVEGAAAPSALPLAKPTSQVLADRVAETVASPPPAPPDQASPSWSAVVRRASEAWTAAYKARDQAKLAAAYTEDACIKVPGHPDACGKSGIEQAAQAVWSAFPDARTAWSRAWLIGDVLGVESVWTGTHDGTMAPSVKRPTHKTAGGGVLTLSWLAPDGRIREQHVYGDLGLIALELGGAGRPFEGLPTTRERHEAQGLPVEESNLEIVRALFTSPMVTAFSRDVVFVDSTVAPPWPGKGSAARWVGARASGLSSARVAITHIWGAEDSVLCEYEVTGMKPGGTFRGTVTLHGAEVYRIEDGLVTLAVRYRDSLELFPPAGLPPPLPSMAP